MQTKMIPFFLQLRKMVYSWERKERKEEYDDTKPFMDKRVK